MCKWWVWISVLPVVWLCNILGQDVSSMPASSHQGLKLVAGSDSKWRNMYILNSITKPLGDHDMAALWPVCSPGSWSGESGSSSQRNDTVNGLHWGGTCNCKAPLIPWKICGGRYIVETFTIYHFTNIVKLLFNDERNWSTHLFQFNSFAITKTCWHMP